MIDVGEADSDAAHSHAPPAAPLDGAAAASHAAAGGAAAGHHHPPEAHGGADGHGSGHRVNATHGLLRACCYVCMTPAAWASPQVLRQRQLGFEFNLTTSHWPHEWLAIGGPVGHLPRNDPSRLSAEQRLLIGYDRGHSWQHDA